MSGIQKQRWRDVLAIYTQPRVIAMFFLGFSAGLPFLLVFATLTAWLKDEGLSKTTIGFFAWIGITYSIKVIWSPVVDHVRIPVLTRKLGQRRSWLLVSQIGIGLGLLTITFIDPKADLALFALTGVWIAFSSATQDISIDAYRIEAVQAEYQGAMAGAYQSGWRIAAALIGGALALKLAYYFDWVTAYHVMAAFALVGVMTTLIISEPEHKYDRSQILKQELVVRFLERNDNLPLKLRRGIAWFIGVVICPFLEFFKRCGWWAILILLFIAIYRISDITLAIMANPFYLDLGFDKNEIADITKIYGVILTIVGAIVGGMLVTRWGVMKPLLIGAVLVASTNLLFAVMASKGHHLGWLAFVVSADNFSGGFAGSAFIAYLSRLTSQTYTATQYALFSSLMTLPAKFISGFSGIVVDARGYEFFFYYAAALGIPAIILVLVLMKLLNIDKPNSIASKIP